MRQTLLTLLTFSVYLLINSCDDRVDPFEAENIAPLVQVSKGSGTSFSDEISDSLKYGYDYEFQVKHIDDAAESTLEIMGELEVQIEGSSTGVLVINNSDDKEKLFRGKVIGNRIGSQEVRFISEDGYSRVDEAKIVLEVFINLNPVARLTISNTANIHPDEWTLNGTASYDRDAAYGGSLTAWYWKVTNTSTGVTLSYSSSPALTDIFQAGNYVVELQVEDNNQEVSNIATATFSIQ